MLSHVYTKLPALESGAGMMEPGNGAPLDSRMERTRLAAFWRS